MEHGPCSLHVPLSATLCLGLQLQGADRKHIPPWTGKEASRGRHETALSSQNLRKAILAKGGRERIAGSQHRLEC